MNVQKLNLLRALEQPIRISQSKMGRSSNRLLISAANGVMSIEANDGDQSCLSKVDVEGDLEPSCVSASVMASAASFGSDVISMVKSAAGSILCKSGSWSLKIKTMPSEEFQNLVGGGTLIVLPADALAEGIRKSSFFAAESSHRDVLKSVHVATSATRMKCESSRGHQISQHVSDVICGDSNFLIPSQFATSVADTLEKESAELLISNGLITVNHKNGRYTCRKMEGQYPNVEVVMGGTLFNIGSIDRDEWVDAFRCIKSLRGDGEALISRCRVEFKDVECLIEAVGGSDYSRSITGKFSPCEFFLNAISFVECLTTFPPKSTINIKILTDCRAVLIELGGYKVVTCQLIDV